MTTTRKVLAVAAMTGATLAGTAGIASAGSFRTGCAAYMVNTHRVAGGMEHAMSVDNPNGNGNQYDPTATGGMWGAIYASCTS